MRNETPMLLSMNMLLQRKPPLQRKQPLRRNQPLQLKQTGDMSAALSQPVCVVRRTTANRPAVQCTRTTRRPRGMRHVAVALQGVEDGACVRERPERAAAAMRRLVRW